MAPTSLDPDPHAGWRLLEVRPARLDRVRGGMMLVRGGTALEAPFVAPPPPWERREPIDFEAVAAIAGRERALHAGL